MDSCNTYRTLHDVGGKYQFIGQSEQKWIFLFGLTEEPRGPYDGKVVCFKEDQDELHMTELHMASLAGDCKAMKDIIDKSEGNKDMIENLISKECKAQAKSLHYAYYKAGHRLVKNLIDMEVTHILKSKGDPPMKMTALHLANLQFTTAPVINLLLEALGDKHLVRDLIQKQDQAGRTAIHYACKQGDTDIVMILLNSFIEEKGLLHELIKISDCRKATSFHYACENEAPGLVRFLLDITEGDEELLKDIFGEDENKRTPLHYACEKACYNVVTILLDEIGKDRKFLTDLILKYDDNKETAFQKAWKRSATGVVKLLLEKVKEDKSLLKKLVLDTDYSEFTLLQDVCTRTGRNDELVMILFDAVEGNGNNDLLKELMLKEAPGSYTALHLACHLGYTKDVKVILDAVGGDGELLEELMLKVDETGKTAFKQAADNGHFETLAALFSHEYLHSHKTMKTLNDGTINEVCAQRGTQAALNMLNAVHRPDFTKEEDLLEGYEGGRYLSRKDREGRTLLHLACSRGEEKLVMKILQYTLSNICDPDSRDSMRDALCASDSSGHTALHESCRLKNSDVLRDLLGTALKVKNDVFDKSPECAEQLLCIKDGSRLSHPLFHVTPLRKGVT